MSGICAKYGTVGLINLTISDFREKNSTICTENNPCALGRGIYFAENQKATVTSSKILNNDESGIVTIAKETMITNNLIEGNGRHAVDGGFFSQGSPTIKVKLIGNTINNNEWGIRLSSASGSQVKNNLLINTNYSSIDFQFSDSVEIMNNTVVLNQNNNSIELTGGNNHTIINNIVAFNKGGNAYSIVQDDILRFEYNLGYGNGPYGSNNLPSWANDTNIELDPLFVSLISTDSSDGLDLHLSPNSPAIDTGDPAILDPDGSRSDMGAYGGPYACQLDPLLPNCAVSPDGGGTNPNVPEETPKVQLNQKSSESPVTSPTSEPANSSGTVPPPPPSEPPRNTPTPTPGIEKSET